ncbi:MAG: GTPase HflX [Rhodobiaceae bacterium]|nr:GTPase HflX [Rhodobiaceae bacterium]MCC0057355.1 GTPase HflX [Rhodobiaceae bacterium]
MPTHAGPTRAFVAVPWLVRPGEARPLPDDPGERGREAKLEEATGLAAAIGLDVVDAIAIPLSKVTPATYLGSGKVAELGERIAAEEIDLVIVDQPISPGQQRNLERAWSCKVLDRTGLILEIFGERARTKEGRLQVEHAHLTWQKSRLVRSWTHLERQRGGFGFLGGPGETQIEADRRQIQTRLMRIEKDLEKVRRTRGLHRQSRQAVPFPVVALVGYTNAGKSSLFNRLTQSDILAEDMLFATLDPTLRKLDLPGGQKAILSDTVGFISELPTTLVAAFRATLEEVISAEIILHVRDIVSPDSAFQAHDVIETLRELGIEPHDKRIIEVWNKIDLADRPAREVLAGQAARAEPDKRPILVSAITGEGVDELRRRVAEALAAGECRRTVQLAPADGRGRSWIYEHCTVLERSDDPKSGVSTLTVSVPSQRLGEFDRRYG